MALTLRALQLLKPYLSNAKILSLGYPDLLVEDCSFLGVTPTKFNQTGRWHGVDYDLPETQHVFDMLGSTLDCIDIHASRGCERIVDLNYPVDLGDYDLVIDAGTVEHVFQIGQAIMNAAGACKSQGRIFHSPPMTMLNHGFYNICPTLLHDFYTQNGWEIEHLSGCTRDSHGSVPATARFNALPNASLHFLAKRLNKEPFRFPTQHKYRVNPDLR